MANNIQGEIERLTKKRDNLQTQLDQKKTSIESRKRSLGSDVLGERDTSKGVDAIARERIELEVLQEGISQAENEIIRLEQQKVSEARAAASALYDQIEAGIRQRLSSEGVDRISAVESLLSELQSEFQKLDEIAPNVGRLPETARFTKELFLLMKNGNGITHSIPHVARNLRESRDILSRVWENNR